MHHQWNCGYCPRWGSRQFDIGATRDLLAESAKAAAEPVPPGTRDADLARAMRLGKLLGVAMVTNRRLGCHAGDCAREGT